MGLADMLKKLEGKSVFIDTAPFIYFMEGTSTYEDILKDLFSKIGDGQINAITSTMT